MMKKRGITINRTVGPFRRFYCHFFAIWGPSTAKETFGNFQNPVRILSKNLKNAPSLD